MEEESFLDLEKDSVLYSDTDLPVFGCVSPRAARIPRSGHSLSTYDEIFGRDAKIRKPYNVHLRRSNAAKVITFRYDQVPPKLDFNDTRPAGLLEDQYKTGAYHKVAFFSNRNWSLDYGAPTTQRCFSTVPRPVRHRIADHEDLKALKRAHPIPEIADCHTWAGGRMVSVSYYMRLWTCVIFANVITIIVVLSRRPGTEPSFTYNEAATATGANIFVATLFRHEHFINLLFRIACALPHATPLWIRRRAAKVYTYGGIHSGCGISALFWYLYYAGLSTRQFEGHDASKVALAVTTSITIVLFVLIISLSHPVFRRRCHNKWEIVHRFSGWTAVVLVWTQTLIIVVAAAHHSSKPVSVALASTPTFYFLVLISLMLVYPWLRVRRRKVSFAERLSPHALRLHFSDRHLPSCVGYRLSTNPLRENHGFATIPDPPPPTYIPASQQREKYELGYSILVSNAGDWTSNLIASPPTKIWTRGAPTNGVTRIATLFTPVLVVATGSGIGPCLSFLQPHPSYPVRILWSCRRPLQTYGTDILDAVFKADPRAIVVDPRSVEEKVDLCALAWALMQESGAEAMVAISNPKVTGEVVKGMERRGVPAFGAIFDS